MDFSLIFELETIVCFKNILNTKYNYKDKKISEQFLHLLHKHTAFILGSAEQEEHFRLVPKNWNKESPILHCQPFVPIIIHYYVKVTTVKWVFFFVLSFFLLWISLWFLATIPASTGYKIITGRTAHKAEGTFDTQRRSTQLQIRREWL